MAEAHELRPVEIRHTIPAEYDWWRRAWLSQLPELETLARGLAAVFDAHGAGALTVLDREINMSWSRCPSEIVTCQLRTGPVFRVLCKYAPRGAEYSAGHRGGLTYEAVVCRVLLSRSPWPTPVFHGAHVDEATGTQWVVIEYLEGAERLHKVVQPGAMPAAARWIGEFHAGYAARVSDPSLSFLTSYDAEYYGGWARRTAEYAGPLHGQFPWLAALCARTDEWVAPLLAAPRTVIHGEYYPDNVLVRRGVPHPVDWESAAIAPGEIDLASLTGGMWPAEVVRECEDEYRRTRWPGGAPPTFERALAAARVYLHFRWLGDQPEETVSDRVRWRFDHLRHDAERLEST